MNNVVHWIILSTGLVLVLCAGNPTAWAQSAADKAVADALFDEGKQLIAKGDDAAACAKFESSLAKAAQLGTHIALATCYEKIGKTASALGAFRAAASAARNAHDKRQRFAEDHVSALEARLSKLTITLARGERLAGLEIKRDGTDLTPAEMGSAVPLDPGEHTVEASAPGRTPWSTTVSIRSTPGVVEVVVPTLEKLPEQHASGSSRRLVRYGVGAGGIAIIGASLVVGAVASSRWNDAKSHCHDNICDPMGLDAGRRARTLGNVSTGLFIGGAVAVAAGTVLWLTVPSVAENPQARAMALCLIPDIGPAQVGLTLQGGF